MASDTSTAGSSPVTLVSDSDFKIDLPQNLLMPEGTGFYIDDISIPVSWYVIEEGRNNIVFFQAFGLSVGAVIPSGNYSVVSLNDAIVKAMNDLQLSTAQFEAAPNVSTNTIGIKSKNSVSFSILTDEQCKDIGLDPTTSINNVLRNFTPQVIDATKAYTWTSGYVDLNPIRNLYIVSSGLGSFNTMSVSGERSIVKKVPVNAGYGELVFDQSLVGIDYLDCSRQTLSRLNFQLKDVFGNVVGLHGQHWSFSIVFSRIQEIL